MIDGEWRCRGVDHRVVLAELDGENLAIRGELGRPGALAVWTRRARSPPLANGELGQGAGSAGDYARAPKHWEARSPLTILVSLPPVPPAQDHVVDVRIAFHLLADFIQATRERLRVPGRRFIYHGLFIGRGHGRSASGRGSHGYCGRIDCHLSLKSVAPSSRAPTSRCCGNRVRGTARRQGAAMLRWSDEFEDLAIRPRSLWPFLRQNHQQCLYSLCGLFEFEGPSRSLDTTDLLVHGPGPRHGWQFVHHLGGRHIAPIQQVRELCQLFAKPAAVGERSGRRGRIAASRIENLERLPEHAFEIAPRLFGSAAPRAQFPFERERGPVEHHRANIRCGAAQRMNEPQADLGLRGGAQVLGRASMTL